MKLTKFGILVNKTTSLFTSIRESNISRGCAKILEIPEGRGVNFGGRFWKIQRGGGVIRQIPSVGGGGARIFSKTTQKNKNPLITSLHFAPVPLILLLLNNIAVCYMCHFTITFKKNKKLLAIHYLLTKSL